jgi:hypothetical protein
LHPDNGKGVRRLLVATLWSHNDAATFGSISAAVFYWAGRQLTTQSGYSAICVLKMEP